MVDIYHVVSTLNMLIKDLSFERDSLGHRRQSRKRKTPQALAEGGMASCIVGCRISKKVGFRFFQGH